MFRGLKKAFSKGRASEVESLGGIPVQSDDAVPVRPRSKSVAATVDEAASSFAGLHSTLPGGGNNAWSNSTVSDSSTPVRRRSGATALSASPSVASPGYQSLSASASPGILKPPAAGTAWGLSASAEKDSLRPTPEKDASRSSPGKETPPKPHARVGGLFRSGSSNARSSTVETSVEPTPEKDASRSSPGKETPPKPHARVGGLFRSGSSNTRSSTVETSVEPMNLSTGNGRGLRQVEEADDVLPYASSKNTQHVQAHPRADLINDAGYPSATRGGTLRAGSLMATPLAVEGRRGPSILG